jgi:Domain of unknown function (DUF5615)
MRLYLDDDSVKRALIQMLRKAGHDVRLPADIGFSGKADAAHLLNSVRENRTLLSRNHDDFSLLHQLVIGSGGHHPGILMIRKDNDKKRDLTTSGIVRALAKLLMANVPLIDQFHILNHWR